MTEGGVQPGSSGSAFWDANKRIIAGGMYGLLQGIYCASSNAQAFGGKFSLTWDGGGTSSNALRFWLDPDNTNVTNLNGKYLCPVLNVSSLPTGTNNATFTDCIIKSQNLVIPSGYNVVFDHQKSTELGPGFEIQLGGTLEIK